MYKDSLINANRYSKAIIAEREEFVCIHGHNGIRHPACFNKANDIKERKGMLDIEAGALNADFDICLSWCIKKSGEEEYTYDNLIKADLVKGRYDSRLIASLVEEMWNYDRLITHYGSNFRFDIPFVRSRYLWLKAREMYNGLPFPCYGEMWLTDTFAMSKRLTKITSRRQDNLAKVMLGKDIKTRIDKDFWMAIKYGDTATREKAIEYIVDHNVKDAEQLDGIYLAMLPFIRETRTSI